MVWFPFYFLRLLLFITFFSLLPFSFSFYFSLFGEEQPLLLLITLTGYASHTSLFGRKQPPVKISLPNSCSSTIMFIPFWGKKNKIPAMVWLTPKIKCNFCTYFVLFLYTLKKGFFLFLVPIRTFPIAPRERVGCNLVPQAHGTLLFSLATSFFLTPHWVLRAPSVKWWGHNMQQSSQLCKLPPRLPCTLPSVVKY